MRGRCLAAVVGACFVVTGCSGGQVSIASDLGNLLASFQIPQFSEAPQADQPGPVPNTISGTLTEKLDEDNSDASSGETKHTIFVVNVRLKQDPSYPPDFGVATYLDDGSTWTHTGQEHNWINSDLCQSSSDVTTDFNGQGKFDTDVRKIEATTRDDSDIGWNLDFNAQVNDAPGTTTVKDQGVDCHTEHGTETDGPGIRCQAPWTTPAVFKFDVVCNEGALTVIGTLIGQ